MPAKLTAIVLALLSAAPFALPAQSDSTPAQAVASPKVTLAGVVKDDQGRLLAATEIVAGGTHRAFIDAKGEFTIPGLDPGVIEFTARRIGYNPVNSAVQSDAGLVVHLSVKLVPVAIQLGTIVVEGKKLDKSLWESGFYKRRDTGMGHYFDDEFFKHRHTNLSTIMMEVPSIRVQRRRDGTSIATAPAMSGYCAMSVYVDGNVIPWAKYSGIDDVINRDDVLAMEVYTRASEIPGRFAGRGGQAQVGAMGSMNMGGVSYEIGGGFTECGAVFIWTKPMGAKR